MVLPAVRDINFWYKCGNRYRQSEHRQDCGHLHQQWSRALDHSEERNRWSRRQNRLVPTIERRTQSTVSLCPTTIREHCSLFKRRHPARRIPRVELLEFNAIQQHGGLVSTDERWGARWCRWDQNHLSLVATYSRVRPYRPARVVTLYGNAANAKSLVAGGDAAGGSDACMCATQFGFHFGRMLAHPIHLPNDFRTASKIRSVFGSHSCSTVGAYGGGENGAPTRNTGASRDQNQSDTARAAISAPIP